jgi:protein-tyrosine phosphatase
MSFKLVPALLCAALLPLAAQARQPVDPRLILVADTPPSDLARRVVPLEGQSNFRDLGGYETADGRHVKWGRIFRSGQLSELTAADYARIAPLHIRTVYDLRDQQERASQPTAWAAGPVLALHSDKAQTGQSSLSQLGPDADAAKARAVITVFYTHAPADYAPEYKAIFHELLEGHAPLLLHCTGGKDRTGVGSALILSALGVPRAVIVEDFALTNRLLRPSKLPNTPFMKAMSAMPPEALAAMTRADPSYLQATFDAIDAQYGSLDAYLAALGVGPAQKARLRALYLE